MKITLSQPIGFSHIGRKDQQEDAVWPDFDKVQPSEVCFVLCDGVGGSEKGEVASQVSSKVIGQYLTKKSKDTSEPLTEADVALAVEAAYNELERIEDELDAGQATMATTLTCVCLNKTSILASHLGDSRIYQVRPRVGLVYKSADHSLVNALLQAGELTAEEAATFPRRNVITKAIQPHGNRRFSPETHLLSDVRSGDYLFLCSDGVMEQLTDEKLVEILSSQQSDSSKLASIENICLNKTRDNFTCYLIPIAKANGSAQHQSGDVQAIAVESSPRSSWFSSLLRKVGKK